MYILKKSEKLINNFFHFTNEQLGKIEMFYSLHRDAKINLTAIKEREQFYLKHILDSVYFLKFISIKFDTAIDLGSGGGFPGMVLAIYFPEKRFFLVESIAKKCVFLKNVVSMLHLSNVDVINSRIENIKELSADIIFSRGVGKIGEILKLTKSVSRETTGYLFYKGEHVDDEIESAKSLIKKRGLTYGKVRVESPIQRTYVYLNSSNCVRLCPKTPCDH